MRHINAEFNGKSLLDEKARGGDIGAGVSHKQPLKVCVGKKTRVSGEAGASHLEP